MEVKEMMIEEDLRTLKLREDGRKVDSLREIKITKDFNLYAEGSVLIEFGNTKVICTASVSDKVPPFMRGQGKGWLTAEYSMIPRATGERNQRESAKGKLSGRTFYIGNSECDFLFAAVCGIGSSGLSSDQTFFRK